ncbi:MAG TPA: FAD-binding oxidoreductase [Candidatus Limnocylindria bacterium]|nr:FAD-binding oxidoreductase [Candidatus Limnocylindria bacterium]
MSNVQASHRQPAGTDALRILALPRGPDLPKTASTVVVGGGVVGAAAAFFLGERGEGDVLVLERDRLGSGTSKGGMGGIRHQFEDELDVRLSQLAVAFWRNFDDRTGSPHAFQERGYLFIANTQEGLAQLREPMSLYERMRVPVEMVGRIEISELVPGIRVDDVVGGRFCGRDGYGDPVVALAGFAAAAQLAGVTFREGVAVDALLREGDRVTGVRTASGDVRAERVLLATGCWTAPLAATAAVPVPIWPYRRSIMESGPIPQLADVPMTIEWESGFHFRPRGNVQRFAMPNLTADGKEEKGPGAAPAAFPGDYAPLDVPASLEPWVRARAAWRHPAFADLRIVDSWSCYYEMTPDDHPIVGAVPGVAGIYVAAGFSGHGFMHSPATAQLVVEEMLDGRARTIDIRDLSLERFQSGRRPFRATVL